jgi:hypothetical protein
LNIHTGREYKFINIYTVVKHMADGGRGRDDIEGTGDKRDRVKADIE